MSNKNLTTAGEDGQTTVQTAAHKPPHEREAEARAAVASIALAEARKIGDLAARREWLLLAQTQLRKSLLHVEAGLERIPA